jgi:plastocyanin
MRTTTVLAVLTALLAGLAAPSSGAGPVQGQILAGPGGYVSVGNYYTVVVAITKGQTVTFSNYDIEPHDVISTKTVGKGVHSRPLFQSRLLDFGGSAPVAGVTRLPPGSYEFYCSLHPWMRAQLVVVAPATPRAGGAR